jgi:hypothetical protein
MASFVPPQQFLRRTMERVSIERTEGTVGHLLSGRFQMM